MLDKILDKSLNFVHSMDGRERDASASQKMCVIDFLKNGTKRSTNHITMLLQLKYQFKIWTYHLPGKMSYFFVLSLKDFL